MAPPRETTAPDSATIFKTRVEAQVGDISRRDTSRYQPYTKMPRSLKVSVLNLLGQITHRPFNKSSEEGQGDQLPRDTSLITLNINTCTTSHVIEQPIG